MSAYENGLTKSILAYLAYNGVFAWRQNNGGVYDPMRKQYRANSSMAGVPDIIGIMPDGRFIGIEVKSPKGKQSEYQKAFEAKCKDKQGIYIVAKTMDDFLQAFAELKQVEDKK